MRLIFMLVGEIQCDFITWLKYVTKMELYILYLLVLHEKKSAERDENIL